MGMFSFIDGVLINNLQKKYMREQLTEIYGEILKYEKNMQSKSVNKIELEEKIKQLKKELESNEKMTKLEKMKKQMDLTLLETKIKENCLINDDNRVEQENIINRIWNMENKIYSSCRFNTTWCSYSDVDTFNRETLKDIYMEEANQDFIETERQFVLEELKPVYEYYINAYNTLKVQEDKLDMLDELIDEMAAEVITKDMKANNIKLPEFVTGMRYFRHESEE